MTDIGWAGLGISASLVAVAVVLSLWRQLGLERSIAWSAIRALAQLLAIGLVLEVLLEPGVSSAWAWLWVAFMLLIAAWTVARRAPVVPGLFGLSLAAFAAYAFSWMEFRGRYFLFVLVVGLMVVPLQMALIPVLRLYTGGAQIGGVHVFPNLHLGGTYLGI